MVLGTFPRVGVFERRVLMRDWKSDLILELTWVLYLGS